MSHAKRSNQLEVTFKYCANYLFLDNSPYGLILIVESSIFCKEHSTHEIDVLQHVLHVNERVILR